MKANDEFRIQNDELVRGRMTGVGCEEIKSQKINSLYFFKL